MTTNLLPGITIAIDVTDWNAARTWYSTKLGLSETFAAEEVGWADFQGVGNGISIGLNRLEPGQAHSGPGGVTLTFSVEDIDAARADLEAKGVEFLGPTNEIPNMVRLATFQDLDGNVMMLAQNLMG